MSATTTVLLASHGAGDGSAANRAVHALADRLRARFPTLTVSAAFQRGAPGFASAVARTPPGRLLVVPLLTSDGYYADMLRHAVTGSSRAEAATVLAPVGLRPEIVAHAAAALARARSAGGVSGHAPVIVVGHGTPRHARSRDSTIALAAALSERIAVRVYPAFLDDDPSLDAVIDALPARPAPIIVPFLVGGGAHEALDVAVRARATSARPASPVVTEALLHPPALTDIIAEDIRRALRPGRPLRIGARGSTLSRMQVRLCADALGAHGVDTTFVPIATQGDADRRTPLDAFGGRAVFADEITDALLAGAIDVAVHSLKDLPLSPPPGIVTAAVLPRAAAQDALVTRDGASLAAMPRGARIGTCSTRRTVQLLRLRPDVVPVPIRGDVETRVAAVLAGAYDGAILAAAGLDRLQLACARGFAGANAAGLAARADLPLDDFLPAPGQGAIALQCREDALFLPLLAAVNDAATEQAVTAELAFARGIAGSTSATAAAFATVQDGRITLRARLLDADARTAQDVTVRGRRARFLGWRAAIHLRVADAFGAVAYQP